jgi:hypothetical protein
MSIALISRTTSSTPLRSGGTLHKLQSGLVCEHTPPSKHLPDGVWRLYRSHQAYLNGAECIAETRTSPTNEFFRSAL